MAAGCSTDVPTAGNTAVDFLMEMQEADFGSAHGMLCHETASSVSVTDLGDGDESEFAHVARLSTASFFDRAHEDPDTLADDLTSTWVELQGNAAGSRETWRFHLEREHGNWRVCSVEFRGSRTCDPAAETDPEVPGRC